MRQATTFVSVSAAVAVALGAASCTRTPSTDPSGAAAQTPRPKFVTVDWAYYNPVSILMKDRGWLEQALEPQGIRVRWVLSLGSNKALEFLRGGSADFASTAGAASVIGRAGGLPIKAIYVYSKPEWTALVTRKGSGIESVPDLAGKKVAVTHGTDPHIFLLRALDAAGLSEADIEAVLVQHPDGYRALASEQVDAWAGLDPHMAKGELESGAILFHRNADANTYGVLNVREAFARDYPDLVRIVLATYERARRYALDHPDELRAGLVKAAHVDEAVARIQLEQRTDLSQPRLTDAVRATLVEAGLVLQKVGTIEAGIEVEFVVDELIDNGPLDALEGPR